jgi:hypothetical protein
MRNTFEGVDSRIYSTGFACGRATRTMREMGKALAKLDRALTAIAVIDPAKAEEVRGWAREDIRKMWIRLGQRGRGRAARERTALPRLRG